MVVGGPESAVRPISLVSFLSSSSPSFWVFFFFSSQSRAERCTFVLLQDPACRGNPSKADGDCASPGHFYLPAVSKSVEEKAQSVPAIWDGVRHSQTNGTLPCV